MNNQKVASDATFSGETGTGIHHTCNKKCPIQFINISHVDMCGWWWCCFSAVCTNKLALEMLQYTLTHMAIQIDTKFTREQTMNNTYTLLNWIEFSLMPCAVSHTYPRRKSYIIIITKPVHEYNNVVALKSSVGSEQCAKLYVCRAADRMPTSWHKDNVTGMAYTLRIHASQIVLFRLWIESLKQHLNFLAKTFVLFFPAAFAGLLS